MEARAIARHVRVSPRKARIVADLVRGKSIELAIETLRYSSKAVSVPIRKTLESAMHNLADRFEHPVEPHDMAIKEIFVDEGRTMYRIRPRAQGRAFRIRKRSSHITVTVEFTGEEPGEAAGGKTEKKASRKTAGKKTAAKKTAARRTTPKKSAPKRAAAKKPAGGRKKPAAKKTEK